MKKQDTLENQVNYAYLSIGSNLGKKIKNLEFTKYKLSQVGVNIIKTSGFYITKSWPNSRYPDFINAVLLIKTKLKITELFRQIKIIEKSLGRKKAPKNNPRTCDIDIIDFNGKCISIKFGQQNIHVPHSSMHKRNFVLIPMHEISHYWEHPKFKKNIVKLLLELPNDDLKYIKFA